MISGVNSVSTRYTLATVPCCGSRKKKRKRKVNIPTPADIMAGLIGLTQYSCGFTASRSSERSG